MTQKQLVENDASQYVGILDRLRRLENARLQNQVYAKVRITAARTWASGAVPSLASALTWDVADFDSGGIWNGSGRLTVPIDGIYKFGFSLLWLDTSATGARDAIVGKNGDGSSRLAEDRMAPDTAINSWLGSSNMAQLSAGEWIALYPSQNSGVSQNITALSFQMTCLWIHLVVPL